MMNEEHGNEKERRQYPRTRAKQGAYAAVCPHERILGQIIDISPGGLAFEYIDSSSENRFDDHTLLRLGGMDLPTVVGLPCRVVEDQGIMKYSPFSFINMRKVRLAFADLTPENREKLDEYISRNTSFSRNNNHGYYVDDDSRPFGLKRL